MIFDNEMLRPNHSLKQTENTACSYAARKEFFREMVTSAVRMVYDDPAQRRRGLDPVRLHTYAQCHRTIWLFNNWDHNLRFE